MWMGLTAAILMIMYVHSPSQHWSLKTSRYSYELTGHSVAALGWPVNAWDGQATVANGGAGARGLPGPNGDGYYHYKRTTREVVPRY